MPGVGFTPEDGIVISGLLRDVGVDAIEVGMVSETNPG